MELHHEASAINKASPSSFEASSHNGAYIVSEPFPKASRTSRASVPCGQV